MTQRGQRGTWDVDIGNAACVEIGRARFRGAERRIVTTTADRLQHLYCIGKTGTGKTSVFQRMALQDIAAGRGCCFVDPHGDAVRWLLARIPAHRREDVVLFDPADEEFPLGVNLLESADPEERDFLVTNAIEIFYKLFDPHREGLIGPQFEHWMRNAALTVMAHPDGGTLLEIPRLFTDRAFELRRRRYLRDPVVQAFWDQQLARTSDFHRSEMLNYFTSKFGRFLSNGLMRNMIGQRANAIRWETVLDEQKIVLITLSKGAIGELNASMLGLILMTKLAAAVLRRAARAPAERVPFFLYVDEFQNVLTDTFLSLLAEARKYGLGVHLAHQHLEQLPADMRSAVLGNARTLLVFQAGAADAEVLLRELEPEDRPARRGLDVETLQFLPPRHFAIKLTYAGTTYPAFLGESTLLDAPAVVDPNDLRDITRLRFALPRALAEAEFRAHWQADVARGYAVRDPAAARARSATTT